MMNKEFLLQCRKCKSENCEIMVELHNNCTNLLLTCNDCGNQIIGEKS